MADDRPIPRGYYAMTVRELRSFIGDKDAGAVAQVMVEIDGTRYPVIKMVRTPPDSHGNVVLRVPDRQGNGS